MKRLPNRSCKLLMSPPLDVALLVETDIIRNYFVLLRGDNSLY